MKAYLQLLAPLALFTVSCAHTAAPKDCPAPLPVESAAFKRLQGLVGEWDGMHPGEKGPEKVAVNYELSSGGSALVEKLFPNTPHEMTSVYTADGSSVLMTHYCMLGNQPRMRLKSVDGNTLHFDFVDGTNIPSPNAPHMHSLVVTLQGNNAFKQEWTFFQDGKATKTEVFSYTRHS